MITLSTASAVLRHFFYAPEGRLMITLSTASAVLRLPYKNRKVEFVVKITLSTASAVLRLYFNHRLFHGELDYIIYRFGGIETSFCVHNSNFLSLITLSTASAVLRPFLNNKPQ